MKLSKKDAKALLGKRHKYGARRTTVDGITFSSKAEANRYRDLRMLESDGQISELKLQPRFKLFSGNGDLVGEYRGDFQYVEDCEIIVEDVKGFKTQLWKWKWKHAKSEYPGIEFREV